MPCTIICTGCGNREEEGVDWSYEVEAEDPAFKLGSVELVDGHCAWKLEPHEVNEFRQRPCRRCGALFDVQIVPFHDLTPEERAKWKRGGRG